VNARATHANKAARTGTVRAAGTKRAVLPQARLHAQNDHPLTHQELAGLAGERSAEHNLNRLKVRSTFNR